jgi:hypothetical protein
VAASITSSAALAEWLAPSESRLGGFFVGLSPKGDRQRLAAAGVYYTTSSAGWERS